ncbi:pentapeptide repeat-containing protein [Streptomyces enissocaesilis]|uniref:Pentapeptide repeat-containing protein n=1 Tax=Streptomyces enissocaesilis TaxID=332589 RepID=A0ABN3XCE8_9ACTN
MTDPNPDGAGPSPEPPSWPYCGHGAEPAAGDPVGCRGRAVDPYAACPAHLGAGDRTAYLARLVPGADIDHRGTPFTEHLLGTLLSAVRDPVTGRPHLGNALFDDATFTGGAGFDGVTFAGDAGFRRAVFAGDAGFRRAVFAGDAGFRDAMFTGDAGFRRAVFGGNAGFRRVAFTGDARFDDAGFTGDARFDGAGFTGNAGFDGADFAGSARFDDATFTSNAWFRRTAFTGNAWFSSAAFTGDAWFDSAAFADTARFDDADFAGNARFHDAKFTGTAWFHSAKFTGTTWYHGATFTGDAGFLGATFAGHAWYHDATFTRDARFDDATFTGDAGFDGTTFTGDAGFRGAVFETASELGPLVCGGVLELSGAVFAHPVTVEAATPRLLCRRTRWASTAALRLRYATVDLSDAVLEYPLSVTARPGPFTRTDRRPLDEAALGGAPAGVRLATLRGTDAAHLVLTDVDLTRCLFAGTVHLDQLRMEGECPMAPAPAGFRRRGWRPVRWTPRHALAEEHHWRAAGGYSGWTPSPGGQPHVPGPAALGPVYRQLRKAFEDGKNEPDAADFYYGEMEMRRKDRKRPRGERVLLGLYWGLSGYGLRASRTLGWLLLATVVTVAVMTLWGLPKDDPKPGSTGTVTGSRISLTTDTPEPVNPDGPLAGRVTTERFEKSLRVVINSVVFRSSGQNLTTVGTYAEMASRITEPVLLGLAVLAVRGRVKR